VVKGDGGTEGRYEEGAAARGITGGSNAGFTGGSGFAGGALGGSGMLMFALGTRGGGMSTGGRARGLFMLLLFFMGEEGVSGFWSLKNFRMYSLMFLSPTSLGVDMGLEKFILYFRNGKK